MPSQCCVPSCFERTGGHCFPTEPVLRKKWIIAIKRLRTGSKTKLWEPSKYSRVCKKHFKPEDYEETLTGTYKSLKKSAVPSLNINRLTKIVRRVSTHQLSEDKNVPETAAEVTIDDTLQQNEDLEENLEVVNDEKDKSIQCSLSISTGMNPFQEFKNNKEAIKYYTSFTDYSHFKLFLDILGPAAYQLNYQCTILSVEEQLFLTLMKLRLCREDFDLALLFKISKSSVSKVFSTWVNFMYYQLKEIDIWPSSDVVKQHMPNDFKMQFPNTRVILDATEIPIQKPIAVNAQSSTFSSYKNRNTLKTMIGCSPSGLISYVSDSYGGRTTDRQIIERSSLVTSTDMFQPGDSIMADRGIMIQDLFATKGVTVNIPHHLKGKTQLSPSEIVYDRRIASKRIHIERIIGLSKTFKILRNELHHSKVGLANKLVFVCFSISNFRNCIVDKYA